MKRTQKHFRPLVGLGVLAAAGLALFAGLTLWLHSGWQAISPTLYDEIAEADQLEGFTLSAQMGWYNHNDLLHFTLRDGRLETNLQPRRPGQPGQGRPHALLCGKPELHRRARGPGRRQRGGHRHRQRLGRQRTISAPVDRVLRTYTLYLPDNTVVRLAAGEPIPGTPPPPMPPSFPRRCMCMR